MVKLFFLKNSCIIYIESKKGIIFMINKWVIVEVDGEVMEFEVLVPENFTEDEAIEYVVEYVMNTIQIYVR